MWVGVKRIAERVSMSQYENAQSVQLREHLIRLAHQQTFPPYPPFFFLFHPLVLSSPRLCTLLIFDLRALILVYAN